MRALARNLKPILGTALISISACQPDPLDSLRARSAFDLNCPAAQVTYTRIQGNCGPNLLSAEGACVMGAAGCGKTETYTYRADQRIWLK